MIIYTIQWDLVKGQAKVKIPRNVSSSFIKYKKSLTQISAKPWKRQHLHVRNTKANTTKQPCLFGFYPPMIYLLDNPNWTSKGHVLGSSLQCICEWKHMQINPHTHPKQTQMLSKNGCMNFNQVSMIRYSSSLNNICSFLLKYLP
jgi:hypothetical protein